MRRIVVVVSVLVLMSTFCVSQQPAASAPAASAQAPLDPEVQKDKTYALEQVQAGKSLGVLGVLERLHKALPHDCGVTMGLADAQLSKAATLTVDAEFAAQRVAARNTYLLADSDKCPGEFASQMAHALPEDGKMTPYSQDPEVDVLIKKGEAAFARRDLDEAKDWYVRAVVLDPKNYHAALYAGDAYFTKKDYVDACEWFQRATEIDPEKEVAHRYWGDALMHRNLLAEARKQYIEAIIAEPYSEFVANGLNNYVHSLGLKAQWYRIKPQAAVSSKDEKNVNITLSALMGGKDDPGGPAWMMYAISRAGYRSQGFAKDHPEEKTYRHSLQEEAGALSLAASQLEGDGKDKKKKKELPEDLAALVKLHEAGFIEPYVLLNVPDDGITKDYAEYRKLHRDVLERYLNEFVLPPAAKGEPSK